MYEYLHDHFVKTKHLLIFIILEIYKIKDCGRKPYIIHAVINHSAIKIDKIHKNIVLQTNC